MYWILPVFAFTIQKAGMAPNALRTVHILHSQNNKFLFYVFFCSCFSIFFCVACAIIIVASKQKCACAMKRGKEREKKCLITYLSDKFFIHKSPLIDNHIDTEKRGFMQILYIFFFGKSFCAIIYSN